MISKEWRYLEKKSGGHRWVLEVLPAGFDLYKKDMRLMDPRWPQITKETQKFVHLLFEDSRRQSRGI